MPLEAVLIVLPVAACTVGPDFTSPSSWSPLSWFSTKPPASPVPEKADESKPIAEPMAVDWWGVFGDRQLLDLEHQVAQANLDVQAATIRLAESRAERRITAAAEFPQVNGDASYQRELPSANGVLSLFPSQGTSGGSGGGSGGGGGGGGGGGASGEPANGTVIPSFNLWQYGFDASWELDLWGRVRRSVEAADANIVASAEDRRGIFLSISAELARDYIELRGIQTQLQISRENLKTAQESLALTQKRAAAGLSTQLDVADAASQVAATEATIPSLEERQAATVNRLSFLLGEPPGSLDAALATGKPIPPVPPRVPIGLPSELARRRPDIREAEARLHAATADIGVAVASFYPTITLNGNIDLQAVDAGDLGSWASRTYSIGPNLSLPIFEGGRLKGNLQLSEAQQQEAAVSYRRTVLNAWQEVDNALTAYEAEQRRRDRLLEAVAENRRALALSRDQYVHGLVAFLQVLNAEQQLLATEQQAADSTTRVSTNLVSLYKALGGGWEKAFPDATAASAGKLAPR